MDAQSTRGKSRRVPGSWASKQRAASVSLADWEASGGPCAKLSGERLSSGKMPEALYFERRQSS